MGLKFYEHTLPELVRVLVALNGNLERAANALEKVGETGRTKQASNPDDARADRR